MLPRSLGLLLDDLTGRSRRRLFLTSDKEERLRSRSRSGQASKLCFVVTVPYAFHAYLRNPLLKLHSEGHAITVLTNCEGLGGEVPFPYGITVVNIPIERRFAPVRDIRTLLRLMRIFREERFDVVHSLLPKSGLLGMVAACLSGVKNRVHTFTGQVWAVDSGARRTLLKSADWFIARCASRVLADSPSQRDFLVSERVVPTRKIEVLAKGSVCGVDLARFSPNLQARIDIRREHEIDDDTIVILFVGRLARAKGVLELLSAFEGLQRTFELIDSRKVKLMLVGPDDDHIAETWRSRSGIIHLGYSSEIERYYSAADIFVLPSYREGFGSVLIEAGAACLPVVATRIYGITDSVVNGDTGLLVEPGQVKPLQDALELLVRDGCLRKVLGERGHVRAHEFFSAEVLTDAWVGFYKDLLVHEAKVA